MKAFVSKYNSLDIHSREILQIFASTLESRNVNEVYKIYNLSRKLGFVSGVLSVMDIDDIFDNLFMQNLLVVDFVDYYNICEDLDFYVFIDLLHTNEKLLKLLFTIYKKEYYYVDYNYTILRYSLAIRDKHLLNDTLSGLILRDEFNFNFKTIIEFTEYDKNLSFISLLNVDNKFFLLDFILSKLIYTFEKKELLFRHVDLSFFGDSGSQYVRQLQEYIMYYYISIGEIDILTKRDWFSESIGIYKFFIGDYLHAKKIFETCLRDYHKFFKTKKKYLPGLAGVLYTLLLLCYKNADIVLANIFINKGLRSNKYVYSCIKVFYESLKSPRDKINYFAFKDLIIYPNIYSSQLLFTVLSWLEDGELKKFNEELFFAYAQAYRNKEYQNQYVLGCFLLGIDEDVELREQVELIKIKAVYIAMKEVLERKEKWQELLSFLDKESNNKSTTKRLAWFFDFENIEFTLFEQTKNKKQVWSKGREVSMKIFKDRTPFSANEKDLRIVDCVKNYKDRYYSLYELNVEKALPFFVGHPNVFLKNSKNEKVEFEKIKPEVLIETTDDNYELSIPSLFQNKERDGFILLKESISKYQICFISREYIEFASMVGESVIKIPLHEKESLSRMISKLSKISSLDSDFIDENIQEVKSDSRCIVQLMPLLEGLLAKILIRPFADFGPYFIPAKGRLNLNITHEDVKLQCKRKVREEYYNLQQFISLVPSLKGVDDYTEDICISDPQDCLDFIYELNELGDKIKIEWPKGETIKIKDKLDASNLNLLIKKRNTWFDIDGFVKLNDKQVIKLKDLIERSRKNESRFVKLDDGMFLALSNEFKRMIEDLDSFSMEKNDVISIHKLAAHGIEHLVDSVGNVDADAEWSDCIAKINQSEHFSCELPSTLEASLRPYQREGFEWMMRLDNWGVGACLADDMGLGKTVQSIAMLIAKAEKGPSIVVAPASVVSNWMSEIHKFSPTLNPVILSSNNRENIISNMEKYDVLIISYGLVYTEIERLENVNWSAVVLDEAHAIKNFMSKRTKAVMRLNADFKLLTTGTPIQNNLTELWSLFNFINPGLLFTQKIFNDRFVSISGDTDFSSMRMKLKNLIKPFILRRTKTQVLSDLPEKTEIVLDVEQTTKEQSFYEALRQKALENIEESKNDDKQGNHILVLAEIMLFEKTIDELIENKHKVLVFSQFVSHLSILKKSLEKKSISYQYLDGSTSLKKREIAVRDFQSGMGDVFLISLKAGGLGLNLTAADYVIHMDPWWNPAVEDQASDRAHRYGQQRPVTIYRMITKNTIEEKMMNLHHEKRELADDILEGTNRANKLTADDLMKLIM